jgi:hypothetical protein
MVNQVFAFSFSNNKITGTGEEQLDKSYKRSLEINEIKELQKGDLTDIDRLQIIDIVSTKEKIAVIKEIQFAESSAVNSAGKWYSNDALVVSIYNRQWKLLKTITLDKKYQANMPAGRSIGINAIGEKLHFVMSAVEGPLSYATVYSIIDLDQQKLEVFKMLNKEGVPRVQAIEGGASLWFTDGLLIEYFVSQGGMLKLKKDFYSIWQKVKL